MQPGTIVQHKQTKRKGIIVLDRWGLCPNEEVPVLFEGENEEGYQGTLKTDLNVLRPPVCTSVSLKKCGMSQGKEKGCAFLIAGGNDYDGKFRCGRGGDLHNSLVINGKEKGMRIPQKMFPDCQI